MRVRQHAPNVTEQGGEEQEDMRMIIIVVTLAGGHWPELLQNNPFLFSFLSHL